MKRMAGSLVALGIVLVVTSNARADDITDWNETMLRAGLVAGSSPLVMTRNAAMVQAAMFDAVNGIDRRYTSIHVDPAGPAGASRRAAAVQAAYAILTKLYGSGAATPNAAQQATLDARRIVSLVDIAAHESGASINSGITWGQFVADAIWTWRSTDGFTITGPAPEGSLVGEWRRTPNLPVSTALSAPGAGYLQFSNMVPWLMGSPSAFRPAAPPPLTSSRYARDFNEVKTMGSLGSAARTPDETTYSLFWNSTSATYFWNRVTLSLIESRSGDDDGEGDALGQLESRPSPLAARERPTAWSTEPRDGRRSDRVLGREVFLQLLAADHRHSRTPGRWQSRTPRRTQRGCRSSRPRGIPITRRVIRASVGRQAPYWHMSSRTASVSAWSPT